MLSAAQAKVLRQLQHRHGRRKLPLFVCEGTRCCTEALRRRPAWLAWAVLSSHCRDEQLRAALAATGAPLVELPDAEFGRWAQTENPQGVLLVLHRPAPAPGPVAGADPFVLVLDQLGDPGNVGTVLRTAWAVGLQRVACIAGGGDCFGPKAVRAGMGAQFALTIEEYESLPACGAAAAAAGYHRAWLAAPRGGVSCFAAAFELRQGVLGLGNEAHGSVVPAGWSTVTIPQPGAAESLNVAQAATVLLFEAVRRGWLGAPGTGATP